MINYDGRTFRSAAAETAGNDGVGPVGHYHQDGDVVWAYELTDTAVAGCSRARMSLDGNYLWAANFNNASTMGAVMRVGMDGLGDPKTIAIRARNHDVAFLPNGHLLYWEQQNGGGYTNGSTALVRTRLIVRLSVQAHFRRTRSAFAPPQRG